MRYAFSPANPARNPSSVDPKLGAGVPMVSGQVYDLAPEWVAHINATSPGENGGPSCIPADDAATPKAEKPKAEEPKAEKPKAEKPKADKPAAPVATPDPAVEVT